MRWVLFLFIGHTTGMVMFVPDAARIAGRPARARHAVTS